MCSRDPDVGRVLGGGGLDFSVRVVIQAQLVVVVGLRVSSRGSLG